MDHEENGVSPLSNDNLFFLYYIFRICGLLISKYDPWWWKFYNILILFYLFSILIGLIISNLFNQINDEPFHIVTIILLCANGCISYLTMTSITLYYGYNLIHIIKSMSTNDMNIYERIHNLRNESSLNNLLLRAFCLKWLAIAFFIGVVSVIFFFVVYGAHADTHFLDLNNNIGWRIVTNIAYIYVNIGWLLPMVLVRVGSHFLERRILRLIAYLELPNDENRKQSDSDTTISEIIVSVAHSFQTSPSPVENNLPSDLTEHNISITQVMSWYDDIYTLNQILSDAFSPIIFQAILLLFPIIIFILEVIRTLLHHRLITL